MPLPASSLLPVKQNNKNISHLADIMKLIIYKSITAIVRKYRKLNKVIMQYFHQIKLDSVHYTKP